jgi:pantoate--beta-alanine ligase
MLIYKTIKETREHLGKVREEGRLVGFVPTMGALHEGHLELVRRARKECGHVSVSIFVNPIQFNNPEDLARYPRTIETDLAMLEKEACDLVFMPSVDEMYPGPVKKKYDFGPLEQVMEGAFRPGHFNGVAIVVHRLFDIFSPDRAYFGEKDFQQLRIIEELVDQESLPVKIVRCPTVREADGLAMSSRNRRLTPGDREIAPMIFKTLASVKGKCPGLSPGELKTWAEGQLAGAGLQVEYFDIADAGTLQPVSAWPSVQSAVACTACWLGGVRLIDNIILFRNFAAPK